MIENKKLVTAIFIVVLAIFLVSGGTLAYWQWITNADQNTLVSASPIDEASMYIDFPSYESKGLYPTSDCNLNATSSWVTEVTVDNDTGVMVAPSFRLKVKIEDKNGNIITNADTQNNKDENDNPLKYRHFIKYAVTEEYGECNKPLVTGRFDLDKVTFANLEEKQPGEEGYEEYIKQLGWYDSNLITIDGSDGFPDVSGRIGTGVSFHAGPNKETTHKYKVWVWMDKEYTYTSQGTESSDPFQDAKITVSWSENSTLEQVRVSEGEAIAIYSADDNSLRFYKTTLPVTEESTYNGKIVTKLYTGFENSTSVPWSDLSVMLDSIVVEDYIYPISTANWFLMQGAQEWDLTKLDTSNVTNMNRMFMSSWGETLDLSHFNTSNVTDMSEMFCDASVNILGIENWDTSNVTNMRYMFMPFMPDKVIDLRGWNVCNVTNYEEFYVGGDTISSIIFPHFGDAARCNGNTNVGKENAVGNAYAVYGEDLMLGAMTLRFYRSLTAITPDDFIDDIYVNEVFTGFENSTSVPWSAYSELVDSIVVEDYIYPISTANWFKDFETELMDLTKLDMSNVTDMSHMFEWVGYETTPELRGLETWDTSNVTNMSYVFNESTISNELINLNNWNISSVTDMSYMFAYANVNVDVTGWKICNNVTHTDFAVGTIINEPDWENSCPR